MSTNKLVVCVLVIGFLGVIASVLELAPAQQPQSSAGEFVLRAAGVGKNDVVVFRFQPRSGKTWIDRDGWKLVKEGSDAPKGPCELHVVSSDQRAEDTWYAFRIEGTSGRTWFIENHAWVAIQ